MSGVGMGLVTSKELCQSLDGDLKVSSSSEMGTLVTFSVLVTNKPFKKYLKIEENLSQKSDQIKSVIMDDSESYKSSLVDSMKSKGFYKKPICNIIKMGL